MNIENLRIGEHVSKAEMKFVATTEKVIRTAGYHEDIQVVGSRTLGIRLKTSVYASECSMELDEAEYSTWLQILNQTIKKHDLSAGNIKDLINYLPQNTPEPIRYLLDPKNKHLKLDNDLDLVISSIPPKLDNYYEDLPFPDGSGLTIDIFLPGQEAFVGLTSPLNF